MQQELQFWGPYSLKSAYEAFLVNNSDGLAAGTLNDYHERRDWIFKELGETTDIRKVTFPVLERLKARARDVLGHLNVTIKRRLDLLLRVLRYAEARGLDVRVPQKLRLPYDGRRIRTIHTVEQWRLFRTYVTPGRFRALYDLMFWTLEHVNPDLCRLQRRHLDVSYVFVDEAGQPARIGGWWRTNNKNEGRGVDPLWFPMEPELIALVPEILDGVPKDPKAPVLGKIWNVKRALDMAADRAAADGHEIPRPTPRDLRRSGASMLIGRGYPTEYVRCCLGHAGPVPANLVASQGRLAMRPTTGTQHYYRPTPALLTLRPDPPQQPL